MDNLQGNANSKVSSLFSGTQEKCVACKKTVYPIEKVHSILFPFFWARPSGKKFYELHVKCSFKPQRSSLLYQSI
uniref:Uncharacterized protein n=1 Tax=Nelumbo nucifera TaxID=4432 RepID=A0A822YF37_NELNU|nr:TPA_asm: hypothetical protein HUJ06_009883 [Nelumbo nucifera]